MTARIDISDLEIPPGFKSMLSPCASAVILFLSREHDAEHQASFADLIGAAEHYRVPTLLVLAQGERMHASPARTLVRRCFNPFDDPEIRLAIRSLSRRRLLIGGSDSQTVLRFAVLSALEEGYDVYLLRELCSKRAGWLGETAIMRMMQAGAVPVNIRQIIAEWGCALSIACEPDLNKQALAIET